jgi:hypothetical protein
MSKNRVNCLVFSESETDTEQICHFLLHFRFPAGDLRGSPPGVDK